MSDSYGILGSALRPANLLEQEFVLVPASHEYIGIVRVCNQSANPETFRLAHTDAAGAASGEDWDFYDTPIEVGETIDIIMEMAAGESLRVQVSTADVISFKYTGLDRDNT